MNENRNTRDMIKAEKALHTLTLMIFSGIQISKNPPSTLSSMTELAEANLCLVLCLISVVSNDSIAVEADSNFFLALFFKSSALNDGFFKVGSSMFG